MHLLHQHKAVCISYLRATLSIKIKLPVKLMQQLLCASMYLSMPMLLSEKGSCSAAQTAALCL